jgi:hypothetical protein
VRPARPVFSRCLPRFGILALSLHCQDAGHVLDDVTQQDMPLCTYIYESSIDILDIVFLQDFKILFPRLERVGTQTASSPDDFYRWGCHCSYLQGKGQEEVRISLRGLRIDFWQDGSRLFMLLFDINDIALWGRPRAAWKSHSAYRGKTTLRSQLLGNLYHF